MKHIAIFDAAAESGKTLKELGFNPTLYCAYRTSLDTGNDLIDSGLRQEVVNIWTASPFEFCTMDRFEALKIRL